VSEDGQSKTPAAVTSDHLAAGKFILTILMWLGPITMGLIAGYGSAKFTAGATEQRLANVEREYAELKKLADENRAELRRIESDGRERFVTRAEIRGYLEGQKDALDQIRLDLRALRQGR
jgi:hypothetical protein